jgi:type I restriction enzyme S subunit
MKQGWELKTLKEITTLLGDGLHGTPQYTVDGDYYFINGNNLTDGVIELKSSTKRVSIDEYNQHKKNLTDRTVLVSINGTLGNVAFYNNEKIILGKSACYFNMKENVDKNYIKYVLSSPYFLTYAHKEATGATIKNVSLKTMREFIVPLPPLQEQQRIVAILDEAFAAIAQAKANAEQNLKNAKELFESYLQSVFENKGEGWEEKTLNTISENLDSKRVPITKNIRKEGSIPYYGASGIVDYVADFLFDEDLLCISEDGANLLARTYPIAFPISGKTWVNNHAHVLRFENMIGQKFVELYLNSIKLDDYVSGMAQPKLNQTMLNKIKIPYPPLKEQEEIVQKLYALSTETKQLESIYQQKINDLDELKKSILQKAFAGELNTTALEV